MPLDNDLGKAPAIARERSKRSGALQTNGGRSKNQFDKAALPHLRDAQFKIQPPMGRCTHFSADS